MRIPCPFCGSRDSREFVTRGDAAPVRPAPEAGPDEEFGAAMHDYVYLRDNPAGEITEWWYHASGCRQWLRVKRDTVTHVVASASLAQGGGA
jgi:methylglutamate dehydrogenase subunit B